MARANTKFTPKKNGVLPEADTIENGVDTTVDTEVAANEENISDNADEEVSGTEDTNTTESQDTFSPSSDDGADVSFSPEVQETKVKVRLNKDHNCCIGGERYYFKKDHTYTVSPNIKRILNKSGLLKPLS